MSSPDPWEALAQNWPTVPVYVRVMPDRWGQTVWPLRGTPYIELAHDADPIQQRCTAAHEYHHLELGVHANEDDVRHRTAKWLLPNIELVGEELQKHGLRVAARRLEVTTRVLNDRLTSLTATERDRLAALLPAATTHRRASEEPRPLVCLPGGPDVRASPAWSDTDARPE